MTALGKRVAVIGAGASGLAATKTCLEYGLEPACLERIDDVGGLWYYQEKVREGYSTVMKSTLTYISKESCSYSDFPVPKEFPNYMPHRYAQRYFRSYAEHFDLHRHIRYNTEVTKVRRADDYAETGRWLVESTDHKSGMKRVETFDAVLVCSGHRNEKHVPKLPGLSDFKGPVLHTHDYRQDASYDDKKILVVGIGNSAGDVAVELSWQAEQVLLSTRRGAYNITTVQTNGKPPELFFNCRFQNWQLKMLPGPWAEAKTLAFFNHSMDHDYFALSPESTGHSPFGNESLFSRINCGQIKVKDDIKEFTSTGVKFVDGSYEDVDVVVMGTGYLMGYPFIEKEVIDIKDNKVMLYKHVFQPDLLHQTLAFIGLTQPLGGFWPMNEMQCRFAAAVFKGDAKLPCREDMWKDVSGHEETRAAHYPNTVRYTVEVDFVTEMDELAEMIGCKPNIGRILLTDPRLAYHLIFGPLVASQYRLEGPGRLKGARETILSVEDRIRFPLQTRPLPPNRNRVRMKVAEWIMYPPMWWAVLLEVTVILLVIMHVFN